ncbi:DoxX family protein [Brevibacterium sp. FME17]|uniref:DoxX family protein n=1 Tax=Brevibacterium sp. FME17 TaxID=2742606 RepID=UPI001D00DADA|nr:DoxX family protein [Brevibacterium sp. FME17]
MQHNLRLNEDPVADEEDGEGCRNGNGSSAARATDRTQARSPGKTRLITVRVLWTGHWLLRIWLAGYLLIYGWSKVFLMQMGQADYSDALVQYGEMSPMGLLWRFMAFSPSIQILAGLAEVAAAAFLLFRRTAWLGALLAALNMGIVFLLNLTFDVPVKQLSGIMALAGVILLIPNLRRLCRFVVGKPTGARVAGLISTNRIFVAITRWAAPLLAIAMLVGSGVVFGNMTDWGRLDEQSAIAGVYSVSGESRADFNDSQITQAAFGQLSKEKTAAVGLRYADGSLQKGSYGVDGDNKVRLKLYPEQKGSQGLIRDYVDEATLTFAIDDSGEITLTGEGLDATLTPDRERRYLFDRDFSWEPRTPVNR